MWLKLKRFAYALVPLCFLIVGIGTLKDYGFNSDEPYHFSRGQAYLHFFLTGKKDYQDLDPYPRLNKERCPEVDSVGCITSPPFPDDVSSYISNNYSYEDAIADEYRERGSARRSFYQNDLFTYEDALRVEDGHPPLGGILAAFTNYIFYQKLGIMGDVESHHLAELLASFLGLLVVAKFVFKNFGIIASIFTSLSIAFYPLFFAEAHFNIKDTFLSSFFAAAVIFFYEGITESRFKKIFLSGVLAGLALGVKFNILFLPIVILPWFFIWLIRSIKEGDFKKKVQ